VVAINEALYHANMVLVRVAQDAQGSVHLAATIDPRALAAFFVRATVDF
jgi:hypothetical protein